MLKDGRQLHPHNSSLAENKKFSPPYASENEITNLLYIDISGGYDISTMKPGIVANEDASELQGSPVNYGAFYAWREVFWIPNAYNNSVSGGKAIVRLTEAYPMPGRIWIAAYNTDIPSWSEWKAIIPV